MSFKEKAAKTKERQQEKRREAQKKAEKKARRKAMIDLDSQIASLVEHVDPEVAYHALDYVLSDLDVKIDKQRKDVAIENSKYVGELARYVEEEVVVSAIDYVLEGVAPPKAIRKAAEDNEEDPEIMFAVRRRGFSPSKMQHCIDCRKGEILEAGGKLHDLYGSRNVADMLNLLKNQINRETPADIIKQLEVEIEELQAAKRGLEEENKDLQVKLLQYSTAPNTLELKGSSKDMALQLFKSDWSVKEVSQKIDTPRSTLYDWKREFKSKGLL